VSPRRASNFTPDPTNTQTHSQSSFSQQPAFLCSVLQIEIWATCSRKVSRLRRHIKKRGLCSHMSPHGREHLSLSLSLSLFPQHPDRLSQHFLEKLRQSSGAIAGRRRRRIGRKVLRAAAYFVRKTRHTGVVNGRGCICSGATERLIYDALAWDNAGSSGCSICINAAMQSKRPPCSGGVASDAPLARAHNRRSNSIINLLEGVRDAPRVHITTYI